MPIIISFPSIWLHWYVIFQKHFEFCNIPKAVLNQSMYLLFFLQQFLEVSVKSLVLLFCTEFCAELKRLSLGLSFLADHLPFGTCCSHHVWVCSSSFGSWMGLILRSDLTEHACYQAVMVQRSLGFF